MVLSVTCRPCAQNAPEQPLGSEAAVSEEQKQHAKQLYQAGLAAYRAGQFSEAIDKLLEANRVMPNGAFSYNIALVYQAMGDDRSALRWLREYLRRSNEKDEKATEKVRTLEAELQSKGLQQVTVFSNPAGATLRIDDNALGITPFTTEIAPGPHTATLTLERYKTAQQSFELRPDRSMDLRVELEPTPSIAATAFAPETTPVITASVAQPLTQSPPASRPPADLARPSRSINSTTWAALGVGTALLGGSVIFEFMRASAEKDARKASQFAYQSEYDTMKSRQTVARVLAVAGGVALTTGVVLLTVDLTRLAPVHSASLRSCGSSGLCPTLIGDF